jgi:hypothetical protein
LAEISNLDKQPLEPATNKPANPVTAANLPVVTEEFTAISMKIKVSIEDEDDSSSTILPDPLSNLQDYKEKLLLHNPTMIASSMASKEYNDFSKLFVLIGQFILHAQSKSTPKNINWKTI